MADLPLEADEWQSWRAYFSTLFPTANVAWIDAMVNRIMKDLLFSGKPTRMTPVGFSKRLSLFRDSLVEILEEPPDPENKLYG
jgi:hypothetical protein